MRKSFILNFFIFHCTLEVPHSSFSVRPRPSVYSRNSQSINELHGSAQLVGSIFLYLY